MPERLECEVLQEVRYINTCTVLKSFFQTRLSRIWVLGMKVRLKNRVPGLADGDMWMILRLLVLTQYQSVTEGYAYAALWHSVARQSCTN